MSGQTPRPWHPPEQQSADPQQPQMPQMPHPAYLAWTAPDGRPLAGPGQRLGARVIDTIVFLPVALVVIGLIVGGVAALLNAVPGDSPVIPVTVAGAIVILVLGLQYLYEVEIPLRWNGQTPGKRAVKIAIIAMEPDVPLGRKTLAYRLAVMFGFNLLSNCYVGLLDPLWCLWDKPYKQCLHDKPAKTVVIRLEPAHRP